MARFSRIADAETPIEEARLEALRLALAPLFFQAARVARETGLMESLYAAGATGLSRQQLAARTQLSAYAVTVLVEALGVSNLAQVTEEGIVLTKTGAVWLKDPLTRVHADFAHHVCYRGAFELGQALRTGLPAGLSTLATGYSTVYQALGSLAPDARAAWDAFDHFSSDSAFGQCLQLVVPRAGHLVDIGCNTGRFAAQVLGFDAQVRVTLVDLPRQLAQAQEAVAPWAPRVSAVPVDVLQPTQPLPAGADVYWMSQFLDCFAESEVVSILRRVRDALPAHGKAYILETFVDTQRSEAAIAAVVGTSLYFACIANGTSRMYAAPVMRRLIAEAGLRLESERHDIGVAHSLLCCTR
jgi:hypothetical protein